MLKRSVTAAAYSSIPEVFFIDGKDYPVYARLQQNCCAGALLLL